MKTLIGVQVATLLACAILSFAPLPSVSVQSELVAQTPAVKPERSLIKAEAPVLLIPAEVRATSQYFELLPDTNAASIIYVGLDGVEPIPSAWLNNPTAFRMDTRGLKEGRYRFTAVAAATNGLQSRAQFSLIIGIAPVVDPITPPVVVDPTVPPVSPAPPVIKKVTYVYEKDNGGIPNGVLVAIDKLNKQGIVATNFEEDTLDSTGETPEQYKNALKAAQKIGLPALVVETATEAWVTPGVTTEAQVLEAAKR